MSVDFSGTSPSVLVTGSTGFLGSRLVEVLVRSGYHVHAFVRKTSNTANLKKLNVEIFYGNVADSTSLVPAFEGIDFVVHAAADTRGDTIKNLSTTTKGTLNIVELSKRFGIKKLIYISSCSVYGVSQFKRNQIVGEDAALERYPEKRGFYSEAKLMAEKLLLGAAKNDSIPFVCLRPGTIFGERGEIYTPMIGFSVGRKIFIIIDNGNSVLPLVYVDNLIDAIILSMNGSKSTGQIYNVVDSDHLTKREYVDALLRKLYPKAVFLFFPYSVLYAMVHVQEILFALIRRKPLLTRYRLISSQQSIVYDSSKIRKELYWNPSVTMRNAISKVLAYELNKPQVGSYAPTIC